MNKGTKLLGFRKNSDDTPLVLKMKAGKSRFRLSRHSSEVGFQKYCLENLTFKEAIWIQREEFDRFRTTLSRKLTDTALFENTSKPLQIRIELSGKKIFSLYTDIENLNHLVIHDNKGQSLTFERESARKLIELLYSDELKHPNDVLNRIIAYHKQFLFSFEEGTASLNSKLNLRKNILSESINYLPKVKSRTIEVTPTSGSKKDEQDVSNLSPGQLDKEMQKEVAFQSKLGERHHDGPYMLDYDQLFTGRKLPSKAMISKQEQKDDTPESNFAFPLPLLVSEVKSLSGGEIVASLSPEEAEYLREHFFQDNTFEFHLGIEICDAIYKSGKSKFKSFRFPLYHLKVEVKLSGRELILIPERFARLYLNHMALANIQERFAKNSSSSSYTVFFKNLLDQRIKLKGEEHRINLSRMLPYSEEIFTRTREVLLGYSGELGKGGLFSSLSVEAIECDLESVYFYRVPKVHSPLLSSVNRDLEKILFQAKEYPTKFYQSLPGKFLSPEQRQNQPKKQVRPGTAFIPGALPLSTRKILEELAANDVVLLEGPPGTGKTFTIMNLLIHSICSKQKILIVSDQDAAIDALTEKILEYLKPRPGERGFHHMKALWKGAVKTINRVPEANHKVNELVKLLEEQLDLEKTKDQGWIIPEAEFAKETGRIDLLAKEILDQLSEHLLSQVGPNAAPWSRIASKRQHPTTVEQIQNFLEFIEIAKKNDDESGEFCIANLVHEYSVQKRMLTQHCVERLESFLMIPESIDATYQSKISDAIDLIQHLVRKKPTSYPQFTKIAAVYPQNELYRALDTLFKTTFPETDVVYKKIATTVQSKFRHPLMKTLKFIDRILELHQFILDQQSSQSAGFWNQILEIDKSLASSFNGLIPLTLEFCSQYANRTSGKNDETIINGSVSQVLDELGALQKKRDQQVRLLFVSNLYKVVSQSLASGKDGKSRLTKLSALLRSLKQFDSIESAEGTYEDLRQLLFESFPFWICRKQAVSFLFPCEEEIFDLVIVDEATQCKVDDALPLLHRAKKILVVGDDKQTVLQKNSDLDDYLFDEFELQEHLRTSQAQAIKGGGL